MPPASCLLSVSSIPPFLNYPPPPTPTPSPPFPFAFQQIFEFREDGGNVRLLEESLPLLACCLPPAPATLPLYSAPTPPFLGVNSFVAVQQWPEMINLLKLTLIAVFTKNFIYALLFGQAVPIICQKVVNYNVTKALLLRLP